MAAGCEGGSWSTIENTWTLWHYETMMDTWYEHGPPPFISLATLAGHKSGGSSATRKESPEDKNFGTMEDLARALGAGDSKKAYF